MNHPKFDQKNMTKDNLQQNHYFLQPNRHLTLLPYPLQNEPRVKLLISNQIFDQPIQE